MSYLQRRRYASKPMQLPPTDRAEGLRCRRTPLRRGDTPAAQPDGISSETSQKKPAKKKIVQTNAIFEQLSQVNPKADADETVLRLSIDAKATVKVGAFSRSGKNRVEVKAADHDFHPEAMVTPVGLLLQERDELALYAVTSKVTSDCLVDILCQWWEANKSRFPKVTTLLLNLDNGPESHSRRTQFLARLVAFVAETGIALQLAYYPPYHSKYNPIGTALERRLAR